MAEQAARDRRVAAGLALVLLAGLAASARAADLGAGASPGAAAADVGAGAPSSGASSPADRSYGAARAAAPVLTAKERLGGKANDEQRVNDCKVPPPARTKPRPDCIAQNGQPNRHFMRSP